MKLSRATLIGLAALSLQACGTLSPVVQPQRLLPPMELLADCPVPSRPSEQTNAAIARWLNAYDAALSAYNDDKAALREWAK